MTQIECTCKRPNKTRRKLTTASDRQQVANKIASWQPLIGHTFRTNYRYIRIAFAAQEDRGVSGGSSLEGEYRKSKEYLERISRKTRSHCHHASNSDSCRPSSISRGERRRLSFNRVTVRPSMAKNRANVRWLLCHFGVPQFAGLPLSLLESLKMLAGSIAWL